jgi:hypothetical protein
MKALTSLEEALSGPTNTVAHDREEGVLHSPICKLDALDLPQINARASKSNLSLRGFSSEPKRPITSARNLYMPDVRCVIGIKIKGRAPNSMAKVE